MKIKLLIILLVVSQTLVYSQRLNQLLKSYSSNDKTELLDFLDWWSDYKKPISDSELTNKSIYEKVAYNIVENFFSDNNIQKLTEDTYYTDMLNDLEYFIVQDEVTILVTDYDLMDEYKYDDDFFEQAKTKIKTIDFRPRINVGKKTIYSDYWFRHFIKSFLSYEISQVGTEGNIMNPPIAMGESRKKLIFLNEYLNVIPTHWNNDWYIDSHPFIESIVFNDDFTKALVFYRIYYEGFRAWFDLKNHLWILNKCEMYRQE